MAHLHSIYDSDAHFCIDPVTRRIKEDTSLKTLLAQGDHNSERFTFELPRIIEGHDMSLCDKVEIHYLNGTNPGVYEVDDLQISPESEDVVIFSWLISNNATQLAATLAFAIKLACTTDGVVDYAYNTLPYDKVTVGKSINNGEVIIQEYADILAQWKQELSDAATNAKVDATLTVSGKAADAKAVGDRLSSLNEANEAQDKLIANKLDASALPTAVNDALEQAKASGEFDGADGAQGPQGPQGETGQKGDTGQAGEAGGYYTPSVTQPSANTMRMSFIPSKDGMPHVAEADITLPSGGSGSVAVDSTLTVSGQAADAKAVGDALAKKQDKPDIRTALDDVAVAGAQYYLGEQTEVAIVLPDDADVGQIVLASWYNGDTAATLSITGTMLGFDFAPSANTRSEINALWDGRYWAVLGNEMEVPTDAETT